MGLIDEREFNKELGGILKSIDQTNKSINDKYKEIIEKGKLDFADAEKMLVLRVAKKLEEEINEYAKKDINYNTIKGAWHEAIFFHIENWDEFKNYRKFIESDAFYRNLNDCLRQSFKKYNIPIMVSADCNCGFSVECHYTINKKGWDPRVGSAEFFNGEKAK